MHVRRVAEQKGIALELVVRRGDVVRIAGRNLEVELAHRGALHHIVRLVVLRIEAQRHRGTIPGARSRPRFLVVVHVPADRGSRLDQGAEAVVVNRRVVARSDAAERTRDDVVHDRAAGTELDRLDPARLGQHLFGDRRLEVHVLIPDVVLDEEVLAHVHDQIRLADRPAVAPFPLLGRRCVSGVAQRRSALGPGNQGGLLLVRERALVLEHPVVPLRRMPRRHQAGFDLASDRARPGPRLLVAGERHRRHHAAQVRAVRAVADLALLLQDRLHVAVVGRRGRGSVVVVVRRRERSGEREDQQQSERLLHGSGLLGSDSGERYLQHRTTSRCPVHGGAAYSGAPATGRPESRSACSAPTSAATSGRVSFDPGPCSSTRVSVAQARRTGRPVKPR